MNIYKKIFAKISNKFKKKFFILIIALFFNSIFELLSISLIIPIYKSITDYQNLINNNTFFFNFLVNLDLTQNKMIILFFLILALIFLLKFIIFSFANRYSFRLIADLKTQISSKIFNNYANRDYIFFKQKNSSFIMRDLLIEVGEFCERYVLSSINLVLETMVIVSLFSFLFFVEMRITIFFSIYILFISVVYFKFIKKKILKAGELRSNIDEKKFSILQEFIRNIKTIKIKNNELFFSKIFKRFIKDFEYSYANFNYVQVLSKPVLEFFGILFVIFWIVINIYLETNLNDLFLSVSLVIFVCLRTLPSVNKLVFSIGQIKFGQPSIKIVNNELEKLKSNHDIFSKKILLNFNEIISLKNIEFKYDESQKNIFSNFNFEIKKGDKICILGKSGEGKTTLIEIISGLLKPKNGQILIDKKKVFNSSNEYLDMTYMPQDLLLIDGTIEDNIAFNQNTDLDEAKVQKAIEFSELSEFVNSLENKTKQKVGEFGGKLSGGQKQRIGIARCFYDQSDLIIFDESLNAIDEKTRSKIISNIFENLKDKTIIFITHDIDFSTHFKKKFILKNGKLDLLN
jgi:ATP-binding cassette subfamily C protein